RIATFRPAATPSRRAATIGSIIPIGGLISITTGSITIRMAVRCSKRPASARRQVLPGYRRYGYYPYRGYYWRSWYYRAYYYGYYRPYRYGYWRRPYYRRYW